MKKVLVTGATGFIGNYVVRELLKRGCDVVATSLSVEKAKQHDWFSEVKYVSFDLAAFDDGVDYFNLFDRPGFAIHLSWEGLPNYKSDFHLEVNLPRHRMFLQNLVRNGLRDLTVTGTCFEYGMKEGMLGEEMPANPANAYARSKDELRVFLEQLREFSDFKLKWIRLFYMYGKGQSPNSLLSQLDKALETGQAEFNMSGGEQIRDYLPVEQVAAHISSIALQEKVTGIINCCSGVPTTVKELVSNYLKSRKVDIKLNLGYYPYPDCEPMAFWGDDAKLKKVYHD